MWEVCSWEKHGLWLVVGWSGFSPVRITVDVRAGRGYELLTWFIVLIMLLLFELDKNEKF